MAIATEKLGDTRFGSVRILAEREGINVEINSVEKNEFVVLQSLEIKNNLYSKSDSCYFIYRKYGSRSYVPQGGDRIGVWDSGEKIFGGKIINVKKRIEGKVLTYDVEAKDWVEELDGLLVSETYKNKTVREIATDLQTKYATDFDISDVNCDINVEKVVWSKKPVSKCLDDLAKLVDYKWYVDADQHIHFFAEGDKPASFNLDDSSGNYIYQSLEVVDDYSQIKNRVNIQGGSISNVQVHDDVSIAAYGEHEVVERDDDLTSIDEATQKANAILAIYKDPLKKGSFRTYKSGLRAGQKIRIQSTLRGIDEYFIIQSVQVRLQTPFKFIYSVEVATQKDKGLIEVLEKEIMKPLPTPDLGNSGFFCDIKFEVVNYHKVSWQAGTIRTTNGEVYNISAGSLEFSGTYVIYFQPATSETVLQSSANFSDAFGTDKIPLCFAIENENTSKGAQVVPISFYGGIQIDGSKTILAHSIIAEQIATNELIVTHSAQIADAIIKNAHIGETITIGNTEAQCTNALADQTSANSQPSTWLSTDIEKAKLGTTVMTGGYLKTGMLNTAVAYISNTAMIANAVITDAKISGTITVGHTDADKTSDNAQSYSWITGTKPPTNADNTQDKLNLGASIDNAKANGITLIEGGYIKTGIISATNIQAGALTGRTVQTAASGNYRIEMKESGSPEYPNTVVWYSSSNSELGRLICSTGGDLIVAGDYIELLTNGTIWAGGDFSPEQNATHYLGSSSYFWKLVYLEGINFDYSNLSEIQKGSYVLFRSPASSTDIQVGSSLYPIIDDNNNLGTSSNEWKNVYAKGHWVRISSKTASGSATIDFQISSTGNYDEYCLSVTEMRPVTDNVSLYLRVASGGYYQASSYKWGWAKFYGGGGLFEGSSSDSEITIGNNLGNDGSEGYDGDITIFNPDITSSYKRIKVEGQYISEDSNIVGVHIAGGWFGGTGAITHLRVFCSNGNIATGTFTLYGRNRN